MLIMLHIQTVGYHLRCFEKIENISRNFLIYVAFPLCLPWELSNRFATLGPAESFWRKLAMRTRFISSFCLLVATSCLNTHARTSRVLFYLYNIQVPKEGRRNMRRLPFQVFWSHDVYNAAKSVLFHLTEPLDEKKICMLAFHKNKNIWYYLFSFDFICFLFVFICFYRFLFDFICFSLLLFCFYLFFLDFICF